MKMLVFAVQFSRGICRPWGQLRRCEPSRVGSSPSAVACGPMAPPERNWCVTEVGSDHWGRARSAPSKRDRERNVTVAMTRVSRAWKRDQLTSALTESNHHRSTRNGRQRRWYVLLRKEVIQPHLPVRLPCYDFTPIANPTFGSSFS